ncbi:tripartite tricarboxylate transporter permease [Brevibacillus marinus]|uniref:tripartite tricarboxylate transporter permease n=1 Tax=Brevibacillus marinus TaxID=2496837 RepID=UPI000F836858|nr:tripartite tricarboxylate transporter permease [Brevibacillus marinus]
MDVGSGILLGLSAVLDLKILFLLLLGSLIGTLVGALPGLGPSAGIALLLPLTFSLTPAEGLSFLVSIYAGCAFGGRITSILLNIPGDSSAVVTCWDGYPMMKRGQGGLAMGISAFSSFIGGMISYIFLMLASPILAKWALKFSAPEYFAMMLFGFAAIAGLSDRQFLKSIMMVLFGVMIAMIGIDTVSGFSRFVFADPLLEGIDFVAVIIGVYGLGEVLYNVETSFKLNIDKNSIKMRNTFPSLADIKQNMGATLRGTTIGTLVGILPGAGSTIASLLAYSTEKNLSKEPEKFGKGKVEGVASPEAANNATVGGDLIPTLALGIPGGGTTAVLLGALIIYGIQPGPRIFETSADVVWTVIMGLFVSNIMLLLLNTLLIPFFIRLMYYSQWYLNALITFLCVVGAFSLSYGTFDIWLTLIFGVIGYFFKKLDYPLGPFILALVLTPIAENSFRQAMILGRGDYSIFLTRPISLVILLMAVLLLLFPIFKKRKKEIPLRT